MFYKEVKKVDFNKAGVYNMSNNVILSSTIPDIIKAFTSLLYLHLNIEADARVAQIYSQVKGKGIRTADEYVEWLKTTEHYSNYMMLKSFNSELYIQDCLEDAKGDGLTKEDFDAFLKELINGFKNEIPKLNGVEGIKSLPNNPKFFFKHFERRFNETAEKYWKKCLRAWTGIENKRLNKDENR